MNYKDQQKEFEREYAEFDSSAPWAASFVDKLFASWKELVENQRWIPVIERLPEHFVTVLLMTGRGITLGRFNFDKMEILYYLPDHSAESLDDALTSLTITHWQLLPAPPEDNI